MIPHFRRRYIHEFTARCVGRGVYRAVFEGVSPADPQGKVCHICVGAGVVSNRDVTTTVGTSTSGDRDIELVLFGAQR